MSKWVALPTFTEYDCSMRQLFRLSCYEATDPQVQLQLQNGIIIILYDCMSISESNDS